MIVLALYEAEARAEQRSVFDLCTASGAPLTTAFRIVLRLEDRRMITRAPDPRDRRRAIVSLSDQTRTALSKVLASLHHE